MAASPKSYTFSCTSGAYVAITTQTQCKSVYIEEDNSVAGWPTTDLKFRIPTNTDSTIQLSTGRGLTIQAPGIFPPGTVVGYVETVTGTTTLMQTEN